MMADEVQEQNVQLVVRRVPDYQVNTDATGRKVATDLPGTFEYGFYVGKRFVMMGGGHAGNHFNADGSHVEPADDQKTQSGESQT